MAPKQIGRHRKVAEPRVDGDAQRAVRILERVPLVVHERARRDRLWLSAHVGDQRFGVGALARYVDAQLGRRLLVEESRGCDLGETKAALARERALTPLELEPKPRLIAQDLLRIR